MRIGWVYQGSILLALGLMFSALAAEGLAVFNACVADASCIVTESSATLDGYLVALLVGIALFVGGVVTVVLGIQLAPKMRVPVGTDPVGLIRPHRP